MPNLRFGHAFAGLSDKNWPLCEPMLKELQKMTSMFVLCQIYGERLQQFRLQPPAPDWDGVTVFEIK
jgi:hypothetical protein